MKKFLSKIKGLFPSKRRLIQLYAALLFNANLKGFINGKIYRGALKNACAPGINCYSCPGASASCPLGALQNALVNSNKRIGYYIFGIILLYGVIFGRMICGFLCPFGLIQDLLYKIKTPKLKKNRFTKIFSYLKYVILAFFVVIVPILYGLRNVTVPGFCKFICPAGTIEGAFGLLSNAVNESELSRLGPLFTWKFLLTVSIVLGTIFIYRLFCRFLCPLGALYGLFNRFSVLGIKLEKPKCIDCGLCISKCKMDITRVGDNECISCGECIPVCPTNAIQFKGGKFFIDTDRPTPDTADISEEEQALKEKKKKSRRLRRTIIQAVAATLMLSLLAGALVYYNFIDKPTEDTATITIYKEGDKCPDVNIPIFDGKDYSKKTFSPLENQGKVTVLNFWYTECGGCVAELPDFERIAADLKDIVTVVALTKSNYEKDSYNYINENYPNSSILWGLDTPIDPEDETSPDILFKSFGGGDAYPITVILDTDGKIFTVQTSGLAYDLLYALIMGAYSS